MEFVFFKLKMIVQKNPSTTENDEESNKAHNFVVQELRTIYNNILNNKQSCTEIARETVLGLLIGRVENEKGVKMDTVSEKMMGNI